MAGGPSAPAFSDQAAAVFSAATKHLLGVRYAPVAVASPVVAGINYAFFCNGSVVYPGGPNEAFIIKIYAPPQGDPVIKGSTG
ncbi:hypothetical protein [Geobacter sp. SVR]|uniref:hypothetical protein n=1 Tax=Geobacter sp. SVR TaxID=2495594 RepID=UPI00143F01E1|nr:hypothetical protein [Geobacter sp. SVR]BCS52694.1 hypothetical protein GSVR_10020 [Geobacter sp. SVR]GCF86810.1 hypothetical protein GSbR_34100 [Geobacter sp. SVR]